MFYLYSYRDMDVTINDNSLFLLQKMGFDVLLPLT